MKTKPKSIEKESLITVVKTGAHGRPFRLEALDGKLLMERVLRPDAPPWDLCVHRARRRRAARGADDAEALRAALSLIRFINLAGDSLPVLTPAATRARLGPLREYNFVTCSAGVTGLRPTAWHEFDASWHKRTAYPDPMLAGTALEVPADLIAP